MKTRTDAQDCFEGTPSAPVRPAGKLPYEKPRVTFREPLEAVAAVCVPPTGKAAPPVCTIGSS